MLVYSQYCPILYVLKVTLTSALTRSSHRFLCSSLRWRPSLLKTYPNHLSVASCIFSSIGATPSVPTVWAWSTTDHPHGVSSVHVAGSHFVPYRLTGQAMVLYISTFRRLEDSSDLLPFHLYHINPTSVEREGVAVPMTKPSYSNLVNTVSSYH